MADLTQPAPVSAADLKLEIANKLGRDTIVDRLAAISDAGGPDVVIARPASLNELVELLSIVRPSGFRVRPLYGRLSQRRVLPGRRTVLVDLSRLNRVLEVNAELGYCIVESGATYRGLAESVSGQGAKLWLDIPDSFDDSLADSFVHRQVGYTPYADHQLTQCGLEVLLANGQLLRTGMGALPGNPCWPLIKSGFGPYIDGLFAQSSNGIITKMGVWLMPEPPGYRPFMVTVPHEGDIEKLFDILRPLKINMVLPGGVVVAHALHEAALLGKTRRDFAGVGPLAAGAVAQAASSLGIGFWNTYGALYGSPENVEIAWGMIQGAMLSIPGARIFSKGDRPGDALWAWREEKMRGGGEMAPSGAVASDGDTRISVHPLAAVDGSDALKLYELSRECLARYGLDYVGQANAVWRAVHYDQIVTAPGNGAQAEARAQDSASALIEAQTRGGFGQVRADARLWDLAEAAYSNGAHALRSLNDRVHKALDPDNLLAMG